MKERKTKKCSEIEREETLFKDKSEFQEVEIFKSNKVDKLL